ncbi:MAG: RNA polymerase-binding transcription factor DksA [Acidimicrobiales bacterium]|nr:MAG: hypothetical protein EDR02_18325 [Actinomycetota bacterium]MBV6509711.1 RNA polymerase-binding transcription factor DksA [Acidimicrobiales bacterium]RIK02651.1 MAG: hypothetical protein DCC48_17850 [Acidobacteriota bacterium]
MSSSPSPSSDVPAVGQRLRAELAAATEHYNQLKQDHEELLVDPAVIQEDRDASAQVLAAARIAMETAAAAVARWEDGTYGRCEVCGSEIPAERLEAFPEASRCMACST